MVSSQELNQLYEELKKPESWHWSVDEKTGWFKHHIEYKNSTHVRTVLQELDKTDPPEAERLRVFLVALKKSFENEESKTGLSKLFGKNMPKGYSVADSIGLLLSHDPKNESREQRLGHLKDLGIVEGHVSKENMQLLLQEYDVFMQFCTRAGRYGSNHTVTKEFCKQLCDLLYVRTKFEQSSRDMNASCIHAYYMCVGAIQASLPQVLRGCYVSKYIACVSSSKQYYWDIADALKPIFINNDDQVQTYPLVTFLLPLFHSELSKNIIESAVKDTSDRNSYLKYLLTSNNQQRKDIEALFENADIWQQLYFRKVTVFQDNTFHSVSALIRTLCSDELLARSGRPDEGWNILFQKQMYNDTAVARTIMLIREGSEEFDYASFMDKRGAIRGMEEKKWTFSSEHIDFLIPETIIGRFAVEIARYKDQCTYVYPIYYYLATCNKMLVDNDALIASAAAQAIHQCNWMHAPIQMNELLGMLNDLQRDYNSAPYIPLTLRAILAISNDTQMKSTELVQYMRTLSSSLAADIQQGTLRAQAIFLYAWYAITKLQLDLQQQKLLFPELVKNAPSYRKALDADRKALPELLGEIMTTAAQMQQK